MAIYRDGKRVGSGDGLTAEQVNTRIDRSKNVKGTHIATLTMSSGNYEQRQGLGPWVLQSGIPRGFSVEDYPGASRRRTVTNGKLIVPAVQVANEHVGWFYELYNGSTRVRQGVMPLGDNDPGPDLANTVSCNIYQRSDNTTFERFIIVLINRNFTIPDGNNFALRIYVALN